MRRIERDFTAGTALGGGTEGAPSGGGRAWIGGALNA